MRYQRHSSYKEGSNRIFAIRLERFCGPVAISPPIADHDVIKLVNTAMPECNGQCRRGDLVMRTVISDAPPPRRLHWQAALTYSPYQSLSPVIWQHRFVSEMPMTSWSCGAKLRLTEFGANTARGRRARAVSKTITYSRCASSSSA